MPELPEVETIRLGLQKYLVGKTIISVDVRLAKMVTGDTTNIIGAIIVSVERFGKGLVIELDNGYAIAIHIKMTGQLLYREITNDKLPMINVSDKVGGVLPGKHTHIIIKLKVQNEKLKVDEGGGSTLYYNDIRQFGWMKVIKRDELQIVPFFKELGPEPLKDLTPEMFEKSLSSAKGPIKPLLMDQKKFAGIGNIYANDALWLAQIHPTRKANTLTNTESQKLFGAIEAVLQKSLSLGGASEINFVNALGQEGSYQHHFLVYNQTGKPCQQCGTMIQKSRVGGRGTFYCPTCQI